MADLDFDFTAEKEFKKAEWIGVNKQYPSDDVPLPVQWARQDLYTLPWNARLLFPGPHLTPKQFTRFPLPPLSSAFITTKEWLWFSTDAPITDVSVLMRRPVPSDDYLTKLDRAFGQKWFDGAKSIVDPRYNDGRERFPLWVLAFWREMNQVAKKQRQWRESLQYLDCLKKKCSDETARAMLDAVTRVELRLEDIGWNQPLAYTSTTVTTLDLAVLLSSEWLSDDHINMMTEYLTNELRKKPPIRDGKAAKIIIAAVEFGNAIQSCVGEGRYTKDTGGGILERYENLILSEDIDELYIPFHVHGNHWIAGYVDFVRCRIGIGDSLRKLYGPPKDVLKPLRKWLKERIGVTATMGAQMTHAEQLDSYNCGIHTGNTLAHSALGIPISEDGNLSRLTWFLDLSRPVPSAEAASSSMAPRTSESTPPSHSGPSSPLAGLRDHNFPDASISDLRIHTPSPKTHRTRISIRDLLNDVVTTESASVSDRDSSSVMDDTMSSSNMAYSSVAPSPAPPSSPTSSFKGAHMDWNADADDPFLDEVGPPEASSPSLMSVDRDMSIDQLDSTYSSPSLMSVDSYDLGRSSDTSKKSIIDHFQSWSAKIGDGFKRKKSPVHTSSDSDTSDAAPRKRVKAGDGQSRTAKLERKQRKSLTDGTFHVNEAKLEAWKKKVSQVDQAVEFDRKDIRRYRCSRCGEWRLVKRPYEFGRFKTHWTTDCAALSEHKAEKGSVMDDSTHTTKKQQPSKKKTTKKNHAINTPSLFSMGFGKKAPKSTTSKPAPRGVSTTSTPTSADATTPLQSKDVPCPGLTTADHKLLDQYLERTAAPGGGGKSLSALTLARFGCTYAELNDEQKDEINLAQNRSHTWINYHELHRVFASDCLKSVPNRSPDRPLPCQRCTAVLNDRAFKNALRRKPTTEDNYNHTNFRFRNPVLGKIYARVRGLKDIIEAPDDTPCIKYAKGVLKGEYKNEIFSGLMEAVVAEGDRKAEGKGMQNFRYAPAWDELAHIIKIHSARAYRAMSEHLPTRSERSFCTLRLYWSKQDNCHYLVGGTEGSIRVLDPDHMKEVLARAKKKKATKDADDLRIHIIPSPRPGVPEIKVEIPIFYGQPVAMIQDSKHALKTFRNNLFAGARFLVFGNFASFYEQIRQMSKEKGTTLYPRDVERLDRQDDNAATRLFCAKTLEFMSEKHPDWAGTVTYLFIFGELVDAYQNRRLPHSERVRMVVRARYYLAAWESYLDQCSLSKSRYLLSREAIDICRFLVEGYLSLLFIHRDDVEGVLPLLPWLHSSEACEHVFGIARKIVKDFSFLDFIYIIPKLRITMREAVLRSQTADAHEQATGYNHTYFDSADIDALALATFPSDEQIFQAALDASEELDSILLLLGIDPVVFHQLQQRFAAAPTLPNIRSWFRDSNDDDDRSSVESDTSSLDLPPANELQSWMERAEQVAETLPRKERERTLKLTFTSLALSVEDTIRVNEFVADPTYDRREQDVYSNEAANLQAHFSPLQLPPVRTADDRQKPFGQGAITTRHLDFSQMVAIRREHQTRHAANSTRVRDVPHRNVDDGTTKMRRDIIREYQDILREAEDTKAVGTGSERALRWKGEPETGNSANAAHVAASTARQLATKGRNAFVHVKATNIDAVTGARISKLRPLVPGDYLIVLSSNELMVARVDALYKKTGGKKAKHEAITTADSITTVSYLGVQLFPFQQGRFFIKLASILHTKKFGHLFSIEVMVVLSHKPTLSEAGLELSNEDMLMYAGLKNEVARLILGIKEYNRRTKELDTLDDEE
ncbi:hypothetical protein BDZ89DRAFT_1111113 [Hymenopellis radicata]|nr:hypothetical protein BDZ89DRAFT_1111113 [Hymenopellis radicata]